jgi:hypothetical protein
VPQFDGGGLVFSSPNLAQQVVSELEALRGWAASQPDGEYLVDRCVDLLAAFDRPDPARTRCSSVPAGRINRRAPESGVRRDSQPGTRQDDARRSRPEREGATDRAS